MTAPRLGFVLTLVLWLAALFAPCSQVISASRFVLQQVIAFRGYRLAALGWLGPLSFSFAWYANIPYFYCVWKLLRGQSPPRRISLIALCLGLTALLPHAIYSEVDGWHRAHFSGPAIWLWLAAYAINLAFAIPSIPSSTPYSAPNPPNAPSSQTD